MSMVSIFTPAPSRRDHKESPLGLYIAVIKENPKASESAQKAAFKRLVLSEGYEDFVEAIVREWQAIKYSTAARAAMPPGITEIKQAAAQRRKHRENEAVLVKTAKQLLGSRLFEMAMPNGKPLGDCTGAECIAFGGFYGAIGRKVGQDKIVRNVLTSDDLGAMAKKERVAA